MRIILALACLLLAACSSSWPNHGTGGLASSHALKGDKDAELIERGRKQIEEAEEWFKHLGQCEPKRYAALEYREADITLLYLKRSHFSEQYEVAQSDYDKLIPLLTATEKRIKQFRKCPPFPPQAPPTKSEGLITK